MYMWCHSCMPRVSHDIIHNGSLLLNDLTHWGRDKMAAISQTTLSNAFSWLKMMEFRFKFQWSLLIRIKLTIFQHWFRWWLGADQATSHYLNQCWLDYRRIYASLGINELISISAWMSHMPSEAFGEISCPFLNFNSCTVWEWISNFIPHFRIDIITYCCCDWG